MLHGVEDGIMHGDQPNIGPEELNLSSQSSSSSTNETIPYYASNCSESSGRGSAPSEESSCSSSAETIPYICTKDCLSAGDDDFGVDASVCSMNDNVSDETIPYNLDSDQSLFADTDPDEGVVTADGDDDDLDSTVPLSSCDESASCSSNLSPTWSMNKFACSTPKSVGKCSSIRSPLATGCLSINDVESSSQLALVTPSTILGSSSMSLRSSRKMIHTHSDLLGVPRSKLNDQTRRKKVFKGSKSDIHRLSGKNHSERGNSSLDSWLIKPNVPKQTSYDKENEEQQEKPSIVAENTATDFLSEKAPIDQKSQEKCLQAIPSNRISSFQVGPNNLKRFCSVFSNVQVDAYKTTVRKPTSTEVHGFECACCGGYYDLLGLNSQTRMERVKQVSKHRAAIPEPRTPEHYWEVGMADHAERNRRGQIDETFSPLSVNPRLSHYQAKARRMNRGDDGQQTRFLQEAEKIRNIEKDIESILQNRQKLQSQLEENKVVKEELGLLEEDATVYKMIGCVLVKQDSNEAKQNVDIRIDYISKELKRLDETMNDARRKLEAQNKVVMSLKNSSEQKKPVLASR